MEFDLPKSSRCHKKRKSADELMRELESEIKGYSSKKKPTAQPLTRHGREYVYCGGAIVRKSPYYHHNKAGNGSGGRGATAMPEAGLSNNEGQSSSQEFHEMTQDEDQNLQGPNSLSQMYEDMSAELRSSRNRARPSDWLQRMESREESWKLIRQQIFEHVVSNKAIPDANECALCGAEAYIRCFHCTPSVLLCSVCDGKVHSDLPLHDREVWTGSYFTPIPPTVTIDPESLQVTTIKRFWPLRLIWKCPKCKATGSLSHKVAGTERRVLVTCEGRFDLDDCIAVCANCDFTYGDSLADVINAGFWPSSAHSLNYLFSWQLLRLFDYLHKFVPGTSVMGFLNALEEISAHNGRVSTINQSAFMKAFEEYRYCNMELLKLGRHPILECPACYGSQHSIHVDGNRKLFRFSKVPRGVRNSYYEGMFIARNSEVDNHLKVVGYKDDNVTGICGTSRFKAAKVSSKTMKNLDETGLVVAGCRHVIAQKAVNMFRGELFGYTHFLHVNEFVPRGVKVFFHDIICQYWPWATRQNFSCQGTLDMIPCLPAMHAKAHSWHCSVLWGGRWQDNAAAGSGEDMELLFSYLSRWGLTKYMLAYRRDEFLTEAAVFWNVRKVKSLPKALIQKLDKTTEKLLTVERKMNEIRLQSGFALSADELDSYKHQIQQIAQGEVQSQECPTDGKERYFLLWNDSGIAAQLREYNTSNTAVDSIITGCDSLYKETNELMSRSAGNLVKLQALEESLLITSEEDRQQCLRDGRILAAKRKIELLQSQMEMIYLSIKKKCANIQNEATSSKQRSNIRHSISAEKSKLSKCVINYNSLVEMVEGFERTSVDDVMDGDFPWSLLTGKRRSIDIQHKLEAAELYNELQRLHEEKALLISEMMRVKQYYQDVISALSKDISDVDSVISVEVPAVGTIENTMKYSSPSVAMEYLKGQKAFVSKSLADARETLTAATKIFSDHHPPSSEANLDDEEFMENIDIDSDSYSSSASDESY